MVLNLNNDFDRQKFRDYGRALMGKRCIVEVKEKKLQRSLAQNRYMHFCLQYFASEFGYSLEDVKYDIFKKTVNKEIFGRTRKNKRGQDVIYLRSTADLDSGEMTEAIDRFRNYSSMVAGLYIPEAGENEAYIEALKQIAGYEQFL